ncbi:hypothetical protein B0J14DRAFT_210345 [Halenospora varia]|nr:hypothetical protein B0J14DRAFT_210345 [Halenospora varia]
MWVQWCVLLSINLGSFMASRCLRGKAGQRSPIPPWHGRGCHLKWLAEVKSSSQSPPLAPLRTATTLMSLIPTLLNYERSLTVHHHV